MPITIGPTIIRMSAAGITATSLLIVNPAFLHNDISKAVTMTFCRASILLFPLLKLKMFP